MKKKFLVGLVMGFLVLLTVGAANATLISDPLASGTYITVDGLDWTWASPVNEEDWSEGYNTLMAPTYHEGWRFATDAEMLDIPSFADFTRVDGTYIQSVVYWNTAFTHVDAGDDVSSTWGHGMNETFYVRDAASPTPEPSTMMLLGFGLVGLAGVAKKKMKR